MHDVPNAGFGILAGDDRRNDVGALRWSAASIG
jgi:hypothetical protein